MPDQLMQSSIMCAVYCNLLLLFVQQLQYNNHSRHPENRCNCQWQKEVNLAKNYFSMQKYRKSSPQAGQISTPVSSVKYVLGCSYLM